MAAWIELMGTAGVLWVVSGLKREVTGKFPSHGHGTSPALAPSKLALGVNWPSKTTSSPWGIAHDKRQAHMSNHPLQGVVDGGFFTVRGPQPGALTNATL